ncbi:MAG: LuxR C-terminal-related transcriptional regulator [Bacillota bacterium]
MHAAVPLGCHRVPRGPGTSWRQMKLASASKPVHRLSPSPSGSSPVCCVGPQRHYIYILCDPELVALKIFAAPEVLIAIEEAGIKPGTVFTEESCGTNALALAREHQRLVAIRGEQHYCRLFKNWWCVAGPVKDPAGNVIGYLDISMHAEKELGLAAVHLQALVDSIQREFLLQELSHRRQVDPIPAAPSRIPPEIAAKLTAREREVLELLLRGLGSKEIAVKLHLSVSTVEDYRKRIYQKLGVRGGMKGLLALFNR